MAAGVMQSGSTSASLGWVGLLGYRLRGSKGWGVRRVIRAVICGCRLRSMAWRRLYFR